jgi:hypothetical protein
MRTRNKRVKSKQRSKANKKNTSKHTANKMTIHQIYGIFDDGMPLKDIKIFNDNVVKTHYYCKKHKINHQLWSLRGDDIIINTKGKDITLISKSCNDLVNNKFKKYSKLWTNLKKHPTSENPHFNPILAADFIRYCILHEHGGIYIDCDIHPIPGKFTKLKSTYYNNPYFFVHWADDKKKLPYNAIMGASSLNEEIFIDIIDECNKSYNKNVNKAIYKQWKGRFIFQVTGHYMINRVIKKVKASYAVLNILRVTNKQQQVVCDTPPKCPNALFEDSNASVWYQ